MVKDRFRKICSKKVGPGDAGAFEAGDAGFEADFDCLMTKCTVMPSLML